MPVVVNRNTTQSPMTAVGNTGTQSIKHIPAGRLYVKATADSVTAAPVYTLATLAAKSNGATPSVGGTWIDLGIMDNEGKITYAKTHTKVQTGIDKVTRMVYVGDKSADFSCNLLQVDDVILTALGFNNSITVPGSVVNYQFGQEDIVQLAMLIVYQNKIDGKEIQWYHPSAKITLSPSSSNGVLSMAFNADLTAFTAVGATSESLISVTMFA